MDEGGGIGEFAPMPKTTRQLNTVFLPGDAETEALGRALGRALQPGDVVLLSGPIGAGKTALARAAISERIGHAEDIPSPTFTLVQVYDADVQIWHSDLYRLTDTDEILELGLDEAFVDAIVFIEWPDRLGSLTPERHLSVTLTPEGDGRRASIAAAGAGWSHIDAMIGEVSGV